MAKKIKLVGRPRKFESVQEMKKLIEDYFNDTKPTEWTVTGLGLSIGASKQLLIDYQGREGYKELIDEAKAMVENSYELSLRKNGRTGDIFALKNFGWKDKQEVESTSTVVTMTPEQAKEISDKLDEEV